MYWCVKHCYVRGWWLSISHTFLAVLEKRLCLTDIWLWVLCHGQGGTGSTIGAPTKHSEGLSPLISSDYNQLKVSRSGTSLKVICRLQTGKVWFLVKTQWTKYCVSEISMNSADKQGVWYEPHPGTALTDIYCPGTPSCCILLWNTQTHRRIYRDLGRLFWTADGNLCIFIWNRLADCIQMKSTVLGLPRVFCDMVKSFIHSGGVILPAVIKRLVGALEQKVTG